MRAKDGSRYDRDHVITDAHKGAVLDRFDRLLSGLTRMVYSGSLSGANLRWQEGNSFHMAVLAPLTSTI